MGNSMNTNPSKRSFNNAEEAHMHNIIEENVMKKGKIEGAFNYSGNFNGLKLSSESELSNLDSVFDQLSLNQDLELDYKEVLSNNSNYFHVNSYLRQLHYQNLCQRQFRAKK